MRLDTVIAPIVIAIALGWAAQGLLGWGVDLGSLALGAALSAVFVWYEVKTS